MYALKVQWMCSNMVCYRASKGTCLKLFAMVYYRLVITMHWNTYYSLIIFTQTYPHEFVLRLIFGAFLVMLILVWDLVLTVRDLYSYPYQGEFYLYSYSYQGKYCRYSYLHQGELNWYSYSWCCILTSLVHRIIKHGFIVKQHLLCQVTRKRIPNSIPRKFFVFFYSIKFIFGSFMANYTQMFYISCASLLFIYLNYKSGGWSV